MVRSRYGVRFLDSHEREHDYHLTTVNPMHEGEIVVLDDVRWRVDSIVHEPRYRDVVDKFDEINYSDTVATLNLTRLD